MIEIAIDENINNIFKNDIRPVFKINDIECKTWSEYRELAHKIVVEYGNTPILIVQNYNADISNNLLSVALFVESCFIQNKLECVVFKVQNRETALNSYKPYVALTIGLKYIIRLYQEEQDNIYKEICNLSYLGLTIREDYLENKIYIVLPSSNDPQLFLAQNKEEALIAIGILKSISLANIPMHLKADISKCEGNTLINIDNAIEKVVNFVFPILS